MNGERVDGERVDGERVDGERVDGERVDGESVNGGRKSKEETRRPKKQRSKKGERKLNAPAIKYSAHFSAEICSSDSSIFFVTAGFSFSSSTNPGESIPAGMNK